MRVRDILVSRLKRIANLVQERPSAVGISLGADIIFFILVYIIIGTLADKLVEYLAAGLIRISQEPETLKNALASTGSTSLAFVQQGSILSQWSVLLLLLSLIFVVLYLLLILLPGMSMMMLARDRRIRRFFTAFIVPYSVMFFYGICYLIVYFVSYTTHMAANVQSPSIILVVMGVGWLPVIYYAYLRLRRFFSRNSISQRLILKEYVMLLLVLILCDVVMRLTAGIEMYLWATIGTVVVIVYSFILKVYITERMGDKLWLN